MKRQLEKLLENVWTLAIVCNQWGDTGKGKLVDLLAALWANIIVRGTGGANAGHTISLKGIEHIFHMLPCGILHDASGKINIIGTGVAFDPQVALEEIRILESAGLSTNGLLISKKAKLVLPQHLLLDRMKESASENKIGTTGRGIGPLYRDHVDRIGLTVNDMLNPDLFRQKLERNLRDKIPRLQFLSRRRVLDWLLFRKSANSQRIAEIMREPMLGGGRFYDKDQIFDTGAITEAYLEYGKSLKRFVADTDFILRKNIGKKKILLEGAQGLLLSIDHGTYPYVTSSDPSISGLAKGCGLREKDVDLTLGIVKFPYMTRVGDGPFPTELGGEEAEEYCRKTPREFRQIEPAENPSVNINDPDPMKQGIAIRITGGEYGATTGRPRRIGWIDLPLLRHAVAINGPDVVLTKLDVLDQCETIKICRCYRYDGPDYHEGQNIIRHGEILYRVPMEAAVLQNCRPLLTEHPGWMESIRGRREYTDLPINARKIIRAVCQDSGINPRLISVGADREEIIVIAN